MCCFFFQAEDGIRDGRVTGVQTCALPICPRTRSAHHRSIRAEVTDLLAGRAVEGLRPPTGVINQKERSEERRVGKEGRSQWSPDDYKTKTKQEDGRARGSGCGQDRDRVDQ